MTPKEALNLLSRYCPCPHDAWEPLGTGEVWARCLDCSSDFELGFREIIKKRSDEFDLAISCLSEQLSLLQGVRDAIGNGADEEAWPPGKTLPEAVTHLRERDNYTKLAHCMGCAPEEVSGLIQKHSPWNGKWVCDPRESKG